MSPPLAIYIFIIRRKEMELCDWLFQIWYKHIPHRAEIRFSAQTTLILMLLGTIEHHIEPTV